MVSELGGVLISDYRDLMSDVDLIFERIPQDGTADPFTEWVWNTNVQRGSLTLLLYIPSVRATLNTTRTNIEMGLFCYLMGQQTKSLHRSEGLKKLWIKHF